MKHSKPVISIRTIVVSMGFILITFGLVLVSLKILLDNQQFIIEDISSEPSIEEPQGNTQQDESETAPPENSKSE